MSAHNPACLCPTCTLARAARLGALTGPPVPPEAAPPGPVNARAVMERVSRVEHRPLRIVCAWCDPRHVISGPAEGPAQESHGMCGVALARQRLVLETERRERRRA